MKQYSEVLQATRRENDSKILLAVKKRCVKTKRVRLALPVLKSHMCQAVPP